MSRRFIAGKALPTLAILGVVAGLLFVRLGDRRLWGDEAETALLARNITKFGLPRTNDGANEVTLFGRNVDANAEGLWVWSPWLDEYVVAASFAMFGPSAWSARLPCALVGLACLPLLGGWFWRRSANASAAWMGMLALGTSELFLLHARQARYYSLIVFAQILLLHGLLDLWERRRRGKWLIAGALLLQFYCNYIVAAANVPALIAIALWCREQMRFRDLLYGLLLTLAGAVPWLLYAEPWRQSQQVGSDPLLGKLAAYSLELHFHVLPLLLLAWPAGWIWRSRTSGNPESPATADSNPHRPDRLLTGLAWFVPSYLLVLGLAPGVYVRYLLPLVAIGAIWVTEWLWAMRVAAWLRWGLFVVLALTNLLPWATYHPFELAIARGPKAPAAPARSFPDPHCLTVPLFGLLDELGHDYHDRTEAVVSFLNANARPGESLFVFDPEFPLMFHTRLRIIDGRLQGSSVQEQPDWILEQSASGVMDVPGLRFPPAFRSRYERLTIPVPASRRGGSLPDPDLREFRTAAATESFVIYRLRRSR